MHARVRDNPDKLVNPLRSGASGLQGPSPGQDGILSDRTRQWGQLVGPVTGEPVLAAPTPGILDSLCTGASGLQGPFLGPLQKWDPA